jgi:hypothetical protein
VSTVQVAFVAALCGIPLLTLAHELGHAAAALHFTDGPVGVRVGRAKPAVRFRVARVMVMFSPLGLGGVCVRLRSLSRTPTLITALAGPCVDLSLALVLWRAAEASAGAPRTGLLALAIIDATSALEALVPIRNGLTPLGGGVPSDGMVALCALRNRPLPRRAPAAQHETSFLRTRVGRADVALAGFGIAGFVALTHAAPELKAVVPAAIAALCVQFIAGNVAPQMARATARVETSADADAASLPREQMRRCPTCGAEVRLAASACYCGHRFEAPSSDDTTIARSGIEPVLTNDAR